MEPTKIYAAYGSNLDKGQMKIRCPEAVAIGKTEIPNWRLVFRGVADVERRKGESVQIGLWRITQRCEEALDRYEGVSSGLYSKAIVRLTKADGGKEDALIYLMNSDGIVPPNDFYYDVILQGYRDFGLDVSKLIAARKHARDFKKATPDLIDQNRARRRREEDARRARESKWSRYTRF